MNATVVDEIEQLRTLKTVALKIKYRQVFGEPSRSLNRQFLFRRIAWRMQAPPRVRTGQRCGLEGPAITDIPRLLD